MEEKIINQENAGNLQQMKEDMKLHIAQLKAELANVDREVRCAWVGRILQAFV